MEQQITQALLDWYDAHKRVLPWRGARDPYAVWVSETMLQQTRVDTVLGYFSRFMERFPTLQALAEAPVEDVLKQWEGLGYYRRARNLQKGAQQVMSAFNGVMPSEPAGLLELCGVGDYTAGAIASIAYGKRVPAVDGNVIRVISRLYGIRENAALPDIRRQITARAGGLLPGDRPGDLNQALMDLGATVCVPGTPDCHLCPLRAFCACSEPEAASQLPVLPAKKPPKELRYRVWLIFRDGKVLMHQRTERMLQGLWVFPMTPQEADMTEEVMGVRLTDVRPVGVARHVFTHQVWQMTIMTARTESEAREPDRFVTASDMDELALPTAMRGPASAARDLLGREK